MKPAGAPLVIGGIFAAGGLLLAAAAISSPGQAALHGATTAMTAWVGKFFTVAEFARSSVAARLGINNTPDAASLGRIKLLVANTLDPLREGLGRPVKVTSGWRAKAVNAAMKGAANNSQHMRGEAADIFVPGLTSFQLAAEVVRLGIPFDQLIAYDPERGGHVHISYTADRANRGEIQHAPARGGYDDWHPNQGPPARKTT